MAGHHEDRLYVIGVDEEPLDADTARLTFRTTCGNFSAIARIPDGASNAVVMLGGSKGGFDGPSSLYSGLADSLAQSGVASLRLDYRMPGVCAKCAIDTLIALQYLDDEGIADVVLVGWSFGGAVAVATGSIARTVRGVAAISTVDVASCCIRRMESRPLLLLHGEADKVSPVEVSRKLYDESTGLRKMIVYPGAGHRMSEVGPRLLDDLRIWILDILACHRAAA